jgi:signal transduction histidine kinase
MVDVIDTGIGLSDEAKEHLFERFYRSPEAKKAATWGMGLGLAIASDLARALGATIEAQGEPGEGSTFTVNFPIAHVSVED